MSMLTFQHLLCKVRHWYTAPLPGAHIHKGPESPRKGYFTEIFRRGENGLLCSPNSLATL